jgi:outer membrane protein
MKNLSMLLNIVLLAAVAHLYYLNFNNKVATPVAEVITAPASIEQGVKIAFVNADTLDAKYEWLKKQKDALSLRLRNAENAMATKQEQLQKDAAAFQEKAQSGNFAEADLKGEYESLMQREQKMSQEASKMSEQLADERAKAYNEMTTNLEGKLKTIQAQIGYDYILSYQRGAGQILLTNDSLDITNQVLGLLNAKGDK